MPSFIPYVAERFTERGHDLSRGLERLKTVSACPVGKGHMNINSEGGIMPCQFAQDWTIGNIREMTLDEATRELFKLADAEHQGNLQRDRVRLRAHLPGVPHQGVPSVRRPHGRGHDVHAARASNGRESRCAQLSRSRSHPPHRVAAPAHAGRTWDGTSVGTVEPRYAAASSSGPRCSRRFPRTSYASRNASTTSGSNWVPEHRMISLAAWAEDIAACCRAAAWSSHRSYRRPRVCAPPEVSHPLTGRQGTPCRPTARGGAG